jgi:hypothetical protein
VVLPIWGNETVLVVEKQRKIEALNKTIRAFINHDKN